MRRKWIWLVGVVAACLLVGGWVYSRLRVEKRIVNLPEQVETVVTGLEVPWEIVFVSEKDWLVTERSGQIRLVKGGKLLERPVANFEDVAAVGEGGLLGMTLDPNFNENGFLYVYYTYGEGENLWNKVVRLRYRDGVAEEAKTIIDRIPGGKVHDGGRIKFGPDGYLYIGTGDAGKANLAQDLNSLAGKILRIDVREPERSINFYGTAVYSFGHRNVQGLAWDDKMQLYATEHGPTGFDEFNWIRPWGNFGWPQVTGDDWQPSLIGPMVHSGSDTWAPSGAVFYKGSVFFGGLRGEAICEMVLEPASVELKAHFKQRFGRIRDVVVGPDGYFYILTNNRDGRGVPIAEDDRIIRISPAALGK